MLLAIINVKIHFSSVEKNVISVSSFDLKKKKQNTQPKTKQPNQQKTSF